MDVAVDDRFLGFESGVHYPTTYLTLSTSTLLLNRRFPIHGLRVRVFIPRYRVAICHWLCISFSPCMVSTNEPGPCILRVEASVGSALIEGRLLGFVNARQ